MTRRAGLVLLAALAAGCQNPFDPKADVRMWTFSPTVVNISRASLPSYKTSSFLHTVTMSVLNYGSVPFQFTSYTVVYRQISAQTGSCVQPPGSPICSLGGSAGRRFSIMVHTDSVLNANTSPNTGMSIELRPITLELIDFLNAPATGPATINGGLDLDITLYGSDHNGHDLKVSGTLHVEITP